MSENVATDQPLAGKRGPSFQLSYLWNYGAIYVLMHPRLRVRIFVDTFEEKLTVRLDFEQFD